MHSTQRRSPRPFAICAATYLLLAVGVAILQSTAPFARGWWLVAYLILVGGLSQLLLAGGLLALAGRSTARPPWAGVLLWNAGTVCVAVADLAEKPVGVLAGSAGLYGALALFGTGWRRLEVRSTWWARGYVLLLGSLAVSVAIGAALAGAVPGA
jgi:hypothetical protein